MAYGTCALCRQYKDLRKSHIIPSFVGKWLKSTSATGFLRNIEEPALRRQDIPTSPLLCEECEQIFSKLELYYAREIFYPFMNDGKRNISYNENLMRFIVSLSWRTLKSGYEAQVSHTPWIKEHVDKAEEVWRKFLINERSDAGPYEHHMLLLDYVEKGPEMPAMFQWYTLRAIDSTLVSNEDDLVYSYSHFPWVIFVSTIYPFQFTGWNGTKIGKKGKTDTKIKIEDGRFGRFLLDRSKMISTATSKTCNTVDTMILKSLSKKPERYLNSESFKLELIESRRKRQEKLKTLPSGIAELINIIDRSLDSPLINSLQQKQLAYVQNLIADDLANLKNDKAIEIHSRVYAALKASAITHEGIHCSFETAEIIGKFI